jgi:hypothetical protein
VRDATIRFVDSALRVLFVGSPASHAPFESPWRCVCRSGRSHIRSQSTFTTVCGRGRLHECRKQSPRRVHVGGGESFGEAGVDRGRRSCGARGGHAAAYWQFGIRIILEDNGGPSPSIVLTRSGNDTLYGVTLDPLVQATIEIEFECQPTAAASGSGTNHGCATGLLWSDATDRR